MRTFPVHTVVTTVRALTLETVPGADHQVDLTLTTGAGTLTFRLIGPGPLRLYDRRGRVTPRRGRLRPGRVIDLPVTR